MKHNYTVLVAYAHQDPKRAWDFTVAREKVEKRGIEKNGFIKTFFNIQKNLEYLIKNYREQITFEIVIKDKNNKVSAWMVDASKTDFDKVTKNNYNKDSLNRYISG